MTTSLLSTLRIVPLDRLEEYRAGWRRLRRAAESAGGRAWLFRAAGREDRFMEFIEFRDAPDLLERPEIAAARASLDEHFAAGRVEAWEDA